MPQNACDLIREVANNIISEFQKTRYKDKNKAINDYKSDYKNYLNFPKEFKFKENKSNAHKELAKLLKKGYKNLSSEIKKQFKSEFYKKNEKRCPMCGQLLESSKKSNIDVPIADLDHFLPKNKYPQFSLLPQNLIPTCMECNRIEKHIADITPQEFKKALNELKLLKSFESHPDRYFKVWDKIKYDFEDKKIKLANMPNAKKLVDLYGIEERYKVLAEKCFNVLFNVIKHSDIRTPESLERFLEGMAASNWHEANDGFSLNNSPHIWHEFIEWILYSESNLLALWEEVKDYSRSICNYSIV
jgi:5-methylcytosine-specific restriction endonuclease McrA